MLIKHAALAVGEDGVGLRRKTVANVSDIFHVDGGAIDRFDRKIVEFGDGLRGLPFISTVYSRVPSLAVPVGKNQILRIDGIDDIDCGEAFCLQRGGVEYRPRPDAACRRKEMAWRRREWWRVVCG